MSVVLTESIVRLCGADHHDDSATVARWTANKTPEGVRKMLANPGSLLFLAERNGEATGVGSVTGAEIGLNYVSPHHRFCGVSKALLAAMEAALRDAGVRVATLSSTRTAQGFYRKAGWSDAGEPDEIFGLRGFPMRKDL